MRRHQCIPITVSSALHTVQCTVHSLQSKCAREHFCSSLGLNLWLFEQWSTFQSGRHEAARAAINTLFCGFHLHSLLWKSSAWMWPNPERRGQIRKSKKFNSLIFYILQCPTHCNSASSCRCGRSWGTRSHDSSARGRPFWQCGANALVIYYIYLILSLLSRFLHTWSSLLVELVYYIFCNYIFNIIYFIIVL